MILSPLDQEGPLFGSTKYLWEQSNSLRSRLAKTAARYVEIKNRPQEKIKDRYILPPTPPKKKKNKQLLHSKPPPTTSLLFNQKKENTFTPLRLKKLQGNFLNFTTAKGWQ